MIRRWMRAYAAWDERTYRRLHEWNVRTPAVRTAILLMVLGCLLGIAVVGSQFRPATPLLRVLWLMILAGAVLVFVARRVWHAELLEQRRSAGQCAACGYDLRGSPGRCPECGAEPQGN